MIRSMARRDRVGRFQCREVDKLGGRQASPHRREVGWRREGKGALVAVRRRPTDARSGGAR
jgi:hypothetical protein